MLVIVIETRAARFEQGTEPYKNSTTTSARMTTLHKDSHRATSTCRAPHPQRPTRQSGPAQPGHREGPVLGKEGACPALAKHLVRHHRRPLSKYISHDGLVLAHSSQRVVEDAVQNFTGNLLGKASWTNISNSQGVSSQSSQEHRHFRRMLADPNAPHQISEYLAQAGMMYVVQAGL